MRYLKKMSLLPTCTSQPPSKLERLEEPEGLALGSVPAGWGQPLLPGQPAWAGGGLARRPAVLWHPLASPRVPSLFGIVRLQRKTQGADLSDA